MNTPLTMKNLNDYLRMNASRNGGWDTEGPVEKEIFDAARYGIAARKAIEKAKSKALLDDTLHLLAVFAELEAGIASRLVPPSPPMSTDVSKSPPPRDNGGSAFPNPIGPRSGMSLRDWFAGVALQGELACQSEKDGTWSQDRFSFLAMRCHLIADAMLAERAKEGVS